AGADGVPADDQPGAEPDAEVSYVTRDLAGVLPKAKLASALAIDDIIARVRDTANWNGGSQNRYQVARRPRTPGSNPALCPRTSRGCPRPALRPPAATAGTIVRSPPGKPTIYPRSSRTSAPRPRRSRRSRRRWVPEA